ncbi:hypothetical protein MPSI1_001427 [Malassezia psittaci]|uniref:Micro-fibrillar-associated protein 1 C-terminal domain-containing protein n=1 Tax=Malassezia psittaci TaxID=1821823 RepID=A0AAF0JDA5_9BASI|nr:hypothetical protein MPSI1_001427 [Malassezia psittaci]
MSGRMKRPGRYRPGKAPSVQDQSSSDEEDVYEEDRSVEATPSLPSRTAIPAAQSAGITIQQGDEPVKLPMQGSAQRQEPEDMKKQHDDQQEYDLDEYETDTDEDESHEQATNLNQRSSLPRPQNYNVASRIQDQNTRQAPGVGAPTYPTGESASPFLPVRKVPHSHDEPAQVGVTPKEASESGSEEETGSDSESESESEPEPVMLKPVFVSRYAVCLPRKNRSTAIEKPQHTTHEPDAMQKARKQAAHDLAAERVQRELREKKHEEAHYDVDDTDDIDPEGEFQAWRARELARIQRIQAQEDEQRAERAEVERRRMIPEKQRLAEDLAHARQTRQEKQRGSQGFLQKYHHKGAFYQDLDILHRDYSQQTESAVDKSALPKLMQVRDFGKRSRSKWTHLANEDTSKREHDMISQRFTSTK